MSLVGLDRGKGYNMNIEDFDFDLPEELIAQTPLEDRASSRLMVLNRHQETIDHKHFMIS